MKQAELLGKVIVAVRIRGKVGVRGTINETLDRLRLSNVNNCSLIKVNEPYLGMLKKCTNHIAYGEPNEELLQSLVEKFNLNTDPKAILSGKADMRELKEKMPMRLHPPRHGYHGKGIKQHFNKGGNVGYMGKDISLLVQRMV
ncbi:MAG: uL30 family ribosomal protein [Candidatus Marsarchaeota archaeon]|nr:uL30 family ribosomal protein [Candidatus Marsarchaeota archaeon]